jgi:hypothetical protein
MRSLLILAFLASSCSSVIGVPDQGVTANGCQWPNGCIALDCTCATRNDVSVPQPKPGNPVPAGGSCVQALVAYADLGVTRPCDTSSTSTQYPTLCFCPTGSQCVEPATICAGKGKECDSGSLCVPPASTNLPPYAPQMVATSDGGLVGHCAFLEDDCVLTPDLGSPADMSASITDMATTD